MRKLFLDTNILLDLLAKRMDFYDEAARLFLLAEEGELALTVSALTIVNTHYVLRKHIPEQKTRGVIRDIRLLVKVLPLDERLLGITLNSDLDDYEDAIQYHTALEYQQEFIITRNLKDFKRSKLPVMTAGQLIHSRQSI
ncbi:MAG: PIN domain-containing protein [Bacteroides sp.]|nr:PIN domain-containing protein [Bacteroides sp.]